MNLWIIKLEAQDVFKGFSLSVLGEGCAPWVQRFRAKLPAELGENRNLQRRVELFIAVFLMVLGFITPPLNKRRTPLRRVCLKEFV